MLRNDHCLSVYANFVYLIKKLFDKQPELHTVVSDVTLHENMTPLTVKDRLLIKRISQTEKDWIVEKK